MVSWEWSREEEMEGDWNRRTEAQQEGSHGVGRKERIKAQE